MPSLKKPIEFETTFDHYIATDIIGEGGTGRVYKAVSDGGQNVAIKVLNDAIAGTKKQSGAGANPSALAILYDELGRVYRKQENYAAAAQTYQEMEKLGPESQKRAEMLLIETYRDGRDIDRVLIWAGATLQAPHRAMAAQRGIAPYGVFVSFFFYGSPATHHGLYAGRRIVEVDGQPTADLDAFIKTVGDKPDRSSLRLKTGSWNGQTDVITLKLDKHYWPAYELDRQKDGSWTRTALDPPQATASIAP